MSSVVIGMSIAAILFSFVTLVLSILSLAYVVGLKNSTHQIQYVPLNDGMDDDKIKKDFQDALSTSFDDDDEVQV